MVWNRLVWLIPAGMLLTGCSAETTKPTDDSVTGSQGTSLEIGIVGDADAPPSKSGSVTASDSEGKPTTWLDIKKTYRTSDTNEPFSMVVLDDRAGLKQDRGNYTMAGENDKVPILPEETYATIKEKCLAAEALLLDGRDKAAYRESFFQLNEALELLPQPRKQWNAGGWILSRLAELYFRMGAYEDSLPVFDDLMWFPGTIGNSWLHLRKGQVLLEVGEKDGASDELMRAYMGGGKEIFENEDPKYYDFLKSQAKGLEP